MPTGLIHLPKTVVPVVPVVPVAFQVAAGPTTTANSFNSGLSRTLSITTTPADGLAGIVVVSAYASTNNTNNRTASWGGVAMTELVQFGSTTIRVSIWGILDPPTGSQTVSVAVTGTGNAGRELWVAGGAYANVGSFGPSEANDANTQTIASAPGEMVVNAFGSVNNFTSYNQTARAGPSTVSIMRAVYGDAPGDSSVTFSTSNGSRSIATRLQPQ